MDDEALIARIADGDPDAMAEFQGRWYRQFVRLATKLTGNPDAAEDIAMDTVVRVISKARTYRAGRKPRSWLLAILYNRARDWARRAGVRWAYSLSGPSDDDEGGPRATEIPDREPPAEEKLIAHERAEAMRAALEKLTAAERAVILLRDYSGLRRRRPRSNWRYPWRRWGAGCSAPGAGWARCYNPTGRGCSRRTSCDRSPGSRVRSSHHQLPGFP